MVSAADREKAEQAYEDAITAFKEEHDLSFTPPELVLVESGEYTSYEDVNMVVMHGDGLFGKEGDVDAYEIRAGSMLIEQEPDWALVEEFTDALNTMYQDVASRAAETTLDVLSHEFPGLTDGGYVVPRVQFYDLSDNTYDGRVTKFEDVEATAFYNVSASHIVVDESLRSQVGIEQGAVGPLLDELLTYQAMHILLSNQDVLTGPRWNRFIIPITDMTGIEDRYDAHLRFFQVMDDLEKDYPQFDPPELRFEGTGYGCDTDRHVITVDPELVPYLHGDAFMEDMHRIATRYLDEALRKSHGPVIDRVADAYAVDAAELRENLQNIYFSEGSTPNHADHNASQQRIRFSADRYRGEFDPRIGTFHNWFAENSKVHEVTHGATFLANPAYNQYTNERETRELEWSKDIRNAGIEAATTFEEFLAGSRHRMSAIRPVMDPWLLPEFLRGYLDLDGDYDPGRIRNPYNFGLFAALNVFDAARQEHDVATAVTKTRRMFRDNVYAPEELQNVLEAAMDHRPIPNFPRQLRSYANLFEPGQNAEPCAAAATLLGVKNMVHERGEDDLELALSWYLDANAVLEAYEHVNGLDEVPDELNRLSDGVAEMYIDHGPTYKQGSEEREPRLFDTRQI